MAKPHTSLGPLVRLWGIKTAQLPTGPVIGGAGADSLAAKDDDDDKARSSDGLTQFLGSLLGEAVPFIDSVSPKNEDTQGKIKIWKPKGSKSYTPTPATNGKVNVELFEQVIKAGELKDLITTPDTPVRDETWVCRRSVHQDKREKGTASWEEFRKCFKEKHPETEKLFTPSVIRMEKRVVWDCQGVPPQTIGSETWSNFSLCILEARHRVGKPLKDRTFPILQMTCSALDVDNNNNMANATDSQAKRESKEKREFLVISVTIPDYFGSTFRKEHVGTGTASSGEDNNHIAKETVIASYASIERIRQLDPPSPPRVVPSSQQPAASSSSSPIVPPVQEEQTGQQSSSNNEKTEVKEKGEIEWLMALTSDAGGVLPMFVQNLAVPGQIAKDVPLFLGWIAKERDKNT
ncbi:Protein of unknown function (DUF3074) domain containing protein [Rhypophila decipiens]